MKKKPTVLLLICLAFQAHMFSNGSTCSIDITGNGFRNRSCDEGN